MRSSLWSALGNRYLVVEAEAGRSLDAPSARTLVGDADGIVEVISSGPDQLDIVIWNPDGSRAELSGNGTRIAAAWFAEATGARHITVRVGARETRATVLANGDIEQDLGEVHVGARETAADVVFVPVTVGNPHAVVLGDPAEIERIGPLLETHHRFPDRTNVQVARVDRPGEVTARVWERGVGETTSSGTSAVAVAAATHTTGDVLVHFPGGDLYVRLEGSRARLTGPAERVG